MTKSLDQELPEFFLDPRRQIQENSVNYEAFSRNDGLFEYRTRKNGVQGVAGSNPAVPIRVNYTRTTAGTSSRTG